MFKRLISILLICALLPACGFHLRGNFVMPKSLDSVTIVGGERDFVEALTTSLQNSGATVYATTATETDATKIHITKLEYLSSVSKTDASGRATGYNYNYNLDYLVTDAKGEVIQNLVGITQKRTLEYDPTQELLAEQEADFLKEEMEKALILQLMRKLSRL